MFPRPLLQVCIAGVIVAMTTLCLAGDPYVISTGRGKYRVVEFPNALGPFELTDDLKMAVVRTNDGFDLLSTQTGAKIGQTLPYPQAKWKVVDNRLFIGAEKGWDVYSLPAFELLKSIPAPPSLPGNGVSTSPQSLTMGWYCRGLFYDDAVEKILASSRATVDGKWQELQPNFFDYSVTKSISVLPFEVRMNERFVELRDYDKIPVSPSVSVSMNNYRYGMRWLTVHGGPSLAYVGSAQACGLYLELVDHDLAKYEFPTQSYTYWNPPSLLISKETDFTKWKLHILPENAALNSKMQVSPSPADEVGSNSAYANTLLRELNNAKLPETDAIFDKYLVEAGPEFKLGHRSIRSEHSSRLYRSI